MSFIFQKKERKGKLINLTVYLFSGMIEIGMFQIDPAILALLIMFYVNNISDIVSTWLAIRVFGCHEANPIARVLFGMFGIRIGGLLLKIPYLILITYIALTNPSATTYWSLMIYDVIFSFVILNNLLASARKAGFFEKPPQPLGEQ